jgi:hypothetical protein
MARIAHRYGFRSISPIWEHPANSALRKLRPNPFVLVQGDSIFIPEKEMAEFTCHTNQRHVFRVPELTQILEQVILDENNQPVADRPYQLVVSGRTIQGRTEADGSLRCDIPLEAKTAQLKVWFVEGNDQSCQLWELQLGHLEPVETVYGWKSHLANLGYDCGPLDETRNEQTVKALRQFQADNHLAQTGEADSATLSQLRKLFNYPVESIP